VIVRWIEIAIWAGIPLAMGYVMFSIKRNLLLSVFPALSYLKSQIGGNLNTRYYYLGAPARIKGVHQNREVILSLDFTHCILKLETWSPPPRKRYLFIHPEVESGIRHEGNHLSLHLKLEQLKGENYSTSHLDMKLAELTTAAIRLEH